MEIILTHENADFDAIASMLGAYKLNQQSIAILPKKIQANVSDFLALYQNGLPFVQWDDFSDGESVEQITITDTSRRLDVTDVREDVSTVIIDHHDLKRELCSHETWAGDLVGSATTLLVERIREQKIELTSLEATLLALGIYSDTGSFTYGGTTARDIQMAGWLIEQGAVLDTIRRFMTKPLNLEQQSLLERLMDNVDSRSIKGFDVVICKVRSDSLIANINTVVSVLRDILDVSALIVLVAMPDHIQLIARSTTDSINVGNLAEYFDGGGHPRASASAIAKENLEEVSQKVWQYLTRHIRPAIRVADLMSFGEVQTVSVNEKITDIIAHIRRIGHEGYPVLDDSEVVGLLTLRSADKALEHGLKQSTVRDVMDSGAITLRMDDSISQLEDKMVSSNWGQIPVLNDDNKLIGIVTRTDLIRHWAQKHPTSDTDVSKVDRSKAMATLGEQHIRLIEVITELAQEQNLYLYMVGGIVRDLLLDRPNFDIDFVLEGSAISFAESVFAQFGGDIHSYPPFGTATWTLNEQVAKKLGLSFEDIPHHLDFATARSELYEHPTALPTVYNSGIKLDLRRRDFTINSIAVQLSPVKAMWHILDFYGGISDLNKGLIRVLHSLSFVDDPTRILRAVRFSNRLGFEIETRTQDLVQSALPMLKRVTGERLQNELTLILKEKFSAQIILKLQELDVLTNIHPDFRVNKEIEPAFELLEQKKFPVWSTDITLISWHVLMATVSSDVIEDVLGHLLIGQNKVKSIQTTAKILQNSEILMKASTKPSAIVKFLSSMTNEGLVTIWLYLDEPLARERIEEYQKSWRHIKPTIDGNILKEMGLKPSPIFREILELLRDAWLDDVIHNQAEELSLLKQLIAEAENDRTS